MNQKNQKKHTVDILFVLILFGVFAFSALMLVIMGSNVYTKTVNAMENNFNNRTSYAYITEKFRRNDSVNSISIEEINSNSAFVFNEIINDVEYETYLYIHDGYLKEMLIKKGNSLPLEAGNIILEASNFSIIQEENNIYHCSLEEESGTTEFTLTARTDQN
jgi:hypothetical protein